MSKENSFPSDANQVRIMPGVRSGSCTYWLDGRTLHELASYRSSRTVLIAFCCTRGQQEECPFKLLIKGSEDDETAQYVTIRDHTCVGDEQGFAKALFHHEVNKALLADAWEKNRERVLKHYEETKLKLGVSDCDLPSPEAICKNLTKRRTRVSAADYMDPRPPVRIPPKKLSGDELRRAEEEKARKSAEEEKQRIQTCQDFMNVRERRTLLQKKIERCEKQKQAILALMAPDFVAPVRVPPETPRYEVVSDEGDFQVLRQIAILPTLDYLKSARPGREYPATDECYVCSDGPSRATFLLCGKVSMCVNCAVKVQLEFKRCTCCNNPGLKDFEGYPRFQIVK